MMGLFNMDSCDHHCLALLPDKNRLRCQHCHLTIKADDLGGNYCPECFETHGEKRYEFENVATIKTGTVRYRCEKCGIIVESE